MPKASNVHQELTPGERERIRAVLMAEDASNALAFQARAIRKYGLAGGILLRELLFWDGKGWDPDGFTYHTKADIERSTGLPPKVQDGGRASLERAGVLEVRRRPRRNKQGDVIHPSPVLHFRPRLLELLEQLAPAHQTLDAEFKHADADARTRGSGCSSARDGAAERADAGAPYTEGSAEATPEVSPEPPAPARDREADDRSHRAPDAANQAGAEDAGSSDADELVELFYGYRRRVRADLGTPESEWNADPDEGRDSPDAFAGDVQRELDAGRDRAIVERAVRRRALRWDVWRLDLSQALDDVLNKGRHWTIDGEREASGPHRARRQGHVEVTATGPVYGVSLADKAASRARRKEGYEWLFGEGD